MNETTKQPSFRHALSTFLAICAVIGVGLFGYAVSLHSLLLICLLIAACSAWYLYRGDFKPIINAMNSGIERALTSIYIFLLIGVLIAAFIQSGTIGTLIYYGLTFISPTIFLPAGLILCSLMSLATGTSWGTVGTAGVVLLAIGTAMGIPSATKCLRYPIPPTSQQWPLKPNCNNTFILCSKPPAPLTLLP